MKTTRKQFVTTIATGLAGAALRPGDLLGVPPDVPEPRYFKGLVGATFRVQPADGRAPIELVLDEYVELKPSNGTRQFSLRFVAPGGESLREGTYFMEQGRTGQFWIFVIPIRRDGQGQTWFRADFNLLMGGRP